MFRCLRIALAAALVTIGGTAVSLDANDIAQLLKNGVEESVVMNMVQSQKLNQPLTAQEVMMLNGNGASSSLLEYLTRRDSVTSTYAASAPQVVAATPTIVTGSDTVTYAQPQPAAPQTNVVVTNPPTVVNACPTTTYVNPSYIYPNTVTTYAYPYTYPTYVYPYPRYRYGPSYSFGFSFGGGRHWRGGNRWHGGRPGGWHGGGGRGRPGGHRGRR